MTFSIAIPVHNGEKCLAAALDSGDSEAMPPDCAVIVTILGGTMTPMQISQ